MLTQIHNRLHVDFVERGQHGVEFFASSRRSATRLRRRVIGHVFRYVQPGPVAPPEQPLPGRLFRRGFRQMFFHIFTGQTPPTPVPLMALASRLCSASRRGSPGLTHRCFALPETPAGVGRSGRFLFRFGAGFFTRAVASRRRPRI